MYFHSHHLNLSSVCVWLCLALLWRGLINNNAHSCFKLLKNSLNLYFCISQNFSLLKFSVSDCIYQKSQFIKVYTSSKAHVFLAKTGSGPCSFYKLDVVSCFQSLKIINKYAHRILNKIIYQFENDHFHFYMCISIDFIFYWRIFSYCKTSNGI